MNSSPHWRIRVLWGLIVFTALFYTARLYWLQIVNVRVYIAQADHQYSSGAGTLYDRGSIFFSGKEGGLISAASLESGFLFAINPSLIKDASAAFEKISPFVSMTRDEFLAKASKSSDTYEEIAHRLDATVAGKIRALDAPWVILTREQWRFYPGGRLGSNVLGLVGYQGDIFSGRYGLERYYDDILSRSKENPYTNLFVELFSSSKDVLEGASIHGDIVSSVEPNVQAALERTLLDINNKWQPDSIGGIVINPQNGEIYALAIWPTFDPNAFSTEKSPRVFSNPIVENVYEMGSIIKPLTMAIGIDTAVVSATTTYLDQGTLLLNGSRISNFDKKGRGVVNMQMFDTMVYWY